MERKRVFDAHVPGILTYLSKNILILSQEAEQSSLQPEYQGVSGVSGVGGTRGGGGRRREQRKVLKNLLSPNQYVRPVNQSKEFYTSLIAVNQFLSLISTVQRYTVFSIVLFVHRFSSAYADLMGVYVVSSCLSIGLIPIDRQY